MRKKLFLLAGGPKNNANTLRHLAEALRGSGKEHPSVAYIGTASADNRVFMKWFEAPLKKAGASSLEMAPFVGKRADRQEAERVLRSCDAIFVSGGEVEDGMKGLDDAARGLLRELWEDGKQLIGLSAGSIMLGKAWPHWDDEDMHPENASLFSCLGFADRIFDTHAETEGWPELKKAVGLSGDGSVGCGIPAGEMAVVDENGILLPNSGLVGCENRHGTVFIV